MIELVATPAKRKLWFDGPNYTADGIVIHQALRQVLLIRRNTGEWALPGGFVDAREDSLTAARREVAEETGVTVASQPTLVFRGVVNDPRNTQEAWIETSAYIFTMDNATAVSGRDDAVDAGWFSLDELPELYASHGEILARAVDHLKHQSLIELAESPESRRKVNGGHMQYDKLVVAGCEQAVFVKRVAPEQYDDPERLDRSRRYLAKEAATMAHLRHHDYSNMPARSVLHDDTLIMDALLPEDGWRWRAESDALDNYVRSAAEAFHELETMPMPADSFDIEPSHTSFMKEGWWTLDDSVIDTLSRILPAFIDRLTPHSQNVAAKLFADLPELRRAGTQLRHIDNLVFCHHDIRQSNIAWHPVHGTKLVDWSWSGLGEPDSDITSLLIDLHKSGHDISSYQEMINPQHCLTLMGFWLCHATWPHRGDDTVRFQQFLSALSAYEILQALR